MPSFATTLDSTDMQELHCPLNLAENHQHDLTISLGCRHRSLYFTVFHSKISIQLAVQNTQKAALHLEDNVTP
jgi:hypothetical protein